MIVVVVAVIVDVVVVIYDYSDIDDSYAVVAMMIEVDTSTIM
jgi:hypothetical protein